MFEWSKNNRACTTTWSTLFVLDQNKSTFDKSATKKMSELLFWAQSASSDARSIQAKGIAIEIDNIFTLVRGATYEKDKTKEMAIDSIAAILIVESKTIKDLAEENDKNYLFWQEVR